MAATAPRTPKPVTVKRPTRGSTRAAGSVVLRTKIPSADIVKDTAGPAVKLGNTAAAKDPRFQKVMDKLDKSASKTKAHPSAMRKAAEAQAAAQPPVNEKLAGAQAQQVETMKDTETKKPDPDSFLTLLRAEIEKVMPKTLGDTENFMEGDQKGQLKGAMTGNVNQQKEEASGPMKSASSQPPDPSTVEGKEVTPLPSEGTPAPPPAVGAADALPAPKAESEVSLQQSKKDADKSLQDAQVTPAQLQKANDPRFSAVLTAKSEVEKQADSAPKKYRNGEQKTLTQEGAKAVADEKHGLTALQGERGKAGAAVKLRQQSAKEKDEARRKVVTDTIEKIYNETRQTVENKLASLETDVSALFDKGIETAMTKMTDYINQRMDAYKSERYDVIGGSLLWAKDKLFGLPDEVNVFYEEGRKVFTRELDTLVISIAKLVDTRLKEAKDEIAKGQKRITEYVQSLPKDLQAVGKAAEKEMAGRFDELRQSVDDKKNDLAQNLAQRYKEASDKANEKLKAMQEENKGLVTKLVEKLGEIIKILREFKDRIMGMLKQGKSALDLIVADPIGFLKNLLNAIKKGISQFVDHIWTHLKAGFFAWLFGSLAEAGISMPTDFSLGSILKLVLQVLGLTYDRIRAKAVKLIGERNVMLLEKAWELISALITGGPAALWEKMKEYLANLKEMVIDAIQDWVVTSVIKSAITKLATMFNPVGAIIQAIITIYNTVMFFIERINQILDFVQAIISSVYKIATGDIDSAANWVEQALARTIPLIIGFLARLLGLSGITDKIKGFILKIQSKVDQAVDKVIAKIVGGIGKLFGKGKEKVGETGKPEEAGKASIKVDKPIAMAGTGHHVYVEEQNSNLVIEMASSRRQKLQILVLSAIRAEEKGAKRKKLLDELEQIHAKFGDLAHDWEALKFVSGAGGRSERDQFMLLIDAMAGKLQDLGREYLVHDLEHLGHPSIYVEVNQLKPEYEKKVRELFYPSGYRSETKDWFEKKKKELENPSNPMQFRDQMTNQWEPKSQATIDHTTRVVEHWNSYGGNNIWQVNRADFFNELPKLRVVAKKNNSSDGAMARKEGLLYKSIVGPEFKGPKDKE